MHLPLSQNEILGLVNRMDLASLLLKRHIEEQIIELVNLSEEWHLNALKDFLSSEKISNTELPEWLTRKGWENQDLQTHIAREESLYRFSKQRFGPGIEERYLITAADLDDVIYSLIRVKDGLLARELWFRLSEGEISFVDAAAQYGQGPEADRKGLIGPIPIGSIEPPAIRNLLRGLSPGEFTSPQLFGGLHLLLRLEQLNPSVLDDKMKRKLLREQLEAFLQERTQALLANKDVEPLHYDPEP